MFKSIKFSQLPWGVNEQILFLNIFGAVYTHVPRPRNSWENMFLLSSQELGLGWWFLVSTYDIELWHKKKKKNQNV